MIINKINIFGQFNNYHTQWLFIILHKITIVIQNFILLQVLKISNIYNYLLLQINVIKQYTEGKKKMEKSNY